MKWALDQIKSALRDKAQRRSVKDLVQSGARSVRVISEEKIFQLIEAVVSDTLGSEAGNVTGVDRERIVAQAKERLDQVLKQNTAAEHRSRRQQETILTYQRQVERLEQERLALLEKSRILHEREARAKQEAVDAAAALAAAHEAAERRGTDASEQALTALRAELADLKAALSGLSEQQPHGLDQAQLDAVISRLTSHEADATRSLEERFATSMNQVLEQVGRTLRAATARPIDRPIEATDVMLTKVFEHESDMESNIADLGVSERSSERTIDRSLERLRAARRGGEGAPSGAGASPAKSPRASESSGATAGATAGATKADRRKGPAERRRSGASRPAASERRKSGRERRKSNSKGKTSGHNGTGGGSRRKT
jgi:hypothetical protein